MKVWKILTVVLLVLDILLVCGLYFTYSEVKSLKVQFELPYIAPPEETVVIPTEAPTTTEPEEVIVQEPEEVVEENSNGLFTLFSDLLASVIQPNTGTQDSIVSITGDLVADDIIFALAEDAGYIRQRIATSSLVVAEGYKVQVPVRDNWIQLKASAQLDGINLGIVSGYRSPEAQKALFLKYFREETSRSGNKEFSPDDIKSGKADKVIMQTLTYTAPPGYSRHHNGYTIDIRDIDSGYTFYEFGKTNGYKWISKNNYENARKYGFIPSYPRGERDGGPEPEPWELVWVGIYEIENLDWTRLR